MNEIEEEVSKFIEYVDTWFPSIVELRSFGSYLIEDNPRDVDVLAIFVEHGYIPPRDAFSSFPHIHYFTSLCFEGESKPMTSIIYRRLPTSPSRVVIHPRVSEREYLRDEVENLRIQVTALRREVKSVKDRDGLQEWQYGDPY